MTSNIHTTIECFPKLEKSFTAMAFKEAEDLFKKLDVELFENIDDQYFYDPKDFRSLVEVLEVLGERIGQIDVKNGEDLLSSLKHQNQAYSKLLNQRQLVDDVIEEVVRFQHGGLNNSVDTMTDVVKEYGRGRDDVRGLRDALLETKSVLTAKKSGQISMKELWLKKKEYEESLRILNDLEWLKDSPLRIQRLMQQKRFFNAVCLLNRAIDRMFSEDLVNITGIVNIRSSLMELKENILDSIVGELRDDVTGLSSNSLQKEYNDGEGSDSEDGESDIDYDQSRSEIRSVHSMPHSTSSKPSTSNNPQTTNNAGYIMDLLAVDETVEMSIQDITASGSLYLRLLVRSVGLLRCEDDVERHLLESTSAQFQLVIRRIRELAYNEYKRKLSDISSSDEIDNIIAAQFSKFVQTLLDSALSCLRKLLYILRLLHMSSNIGQLELGNSTATNGGNMNYHCTIKESNKRAIFNLWTDMEYMIIAELRMHFIEKDIENISDIKSSAASSGGGGGTMIGSQTKGINSGSLLSSKKNKPPGDHTLDDEVDNETEENVPIFPASVRLSAKVYRSIVIFAESMKGVMREGHLLENSNNSNNSNNTNTINNKSNAAKKGPTVLEKLNANAPVEVECKILDSIQEILETELIPVVQGSANQEMREIVLNNENLSLPPLHLMQQRPDLYGILSHDGIPVPIAAQACFRAAKPLFNYWIQLPQHCDMVSTIFDRLVRGFISFAREEIEAISWKLIAADNKFSKPELQAMKHDPAYKSYRSHVFSGPSSVDEIVAGRDNAPKTISGPHSNDLTNTSKQPSADNSHWAPLLEVDQLPYVVTLDKTIQNMNSISTVASIIQSADWLAIQFLKSCQQSSRKLQQSQGGMSTSLGSGKQSSVSGSGAVGIGQNKLSRNDPLDNIQTSLWKAVADCCKELIKLSDEGLTLIRAELQTSSYYYLQKFAQVRLHGTGSGSKSHADRLEYQATGRGSASMSDSTSSETDGLLANLIQHLMRVQNAVLGGTSSHALAVIFSPIATAIPAMLMKCIENQLLVNNMSMTHAQDKTRILKIVVTCQQSIVMLLESSSNPSGIIDSPVKSSLNAKISATAISEFEKVRRFVALMDMNPSELQTFIKINHSEYAESSFKALFKHVSER